MYPLLQTHELDLCCGLALAIPHDAHFPFWPGSHLRAETYEVKAVAIIAIVSNEIFIFILHLNKVIKHTLKLLYPYFFSLGQTIP